MALGAAELQLMINAKDNASGVFSKMRKNVGVAMTAAGGAITGIAALSISEFAAMGDEVHKMALRTGFSTEALSEFRFVAEQSGTSLDGVEKAVTKMQRVITDAGMGMQGAKDSLDALGLSAEQLEGLSPEKQFELMSNALADVGDASQQAAFAQMVFGKSGVQLLPMLKSGSDGIADMRQQARDLGIVMGEDAANAAAEFGDAQNRLNKGLTGVKLAIGEALVPILTVLIDKVVAGVQWFQNFRDQNPALAKVITIVVAGLGALMLVLGPLLLILPMITAAVASFGVVITIATGPVGLIILAIIALIAIGVLLMKNWDKIRDFAVGVFEAIRDTITGVFKAIIGWLKEHWMTILGILTGPIGLAVVMIIKHRDTILEIFNALIRKVGEFFSRLKGIPDAIKGAVKDVPLLGGIAGKLFGAQGGTSFHPGGMTLVGERGPEIVNVPRGAQVIPNAMAGIGGITIINRGTIVHDSAFTDLVVAAIEKGRRQGRI